MNCASRSSVLAIWVLAICMSRGQSPNQPLEKVGPNVRPPVPLNAPAAEMSNEARLKNISGICMVSIIVDEKGKTTKVRLIRCTDPIFAANSISAVSKYRFKPAVRISDSSPVPVMIRVDVNFRRTDLRFDANELWAPLLVRYSFLSPPEMSSTAPDSLGIYPLSMSMKQPEFAGVDTRSMGALVADFKDGFDCHVMMTINDTGAPANPEHANCENPEAAKAVEGFLSNARFRPAETNGSRVSVRTLIHFSNIGINHLSKLDPEGSEPSAIKPTSVGNIAAKP